MSPARIYPTFSINNGVKWVKVWYSMTLYEVVGYVLVVLL